MTELSEAKLAPLSNPLKIGRLVHLTDGHNCVPMIVNIVSDPEQEIIGGNAFAHPTVASVVGIRHDRNVKPSPAVPARPSPITGPNGQSVTTYINTWHWPNECAWER